MKKWFLLWIALLLTCKSFAGSYLATFDDYGKIEIFESAQGIRVEIDLQTEPMQKYMIKLLSACKRTSPYWVRFRHSFEIIAISDRNGAILRSSHFPGMHDRDLRSRNLNTVALYKLEKSYWKMLKCVALREPQKDSLDMQDNSQS